MKGGRRDREGEREREKEGGRMDREEKGRRERNKWFEFCKTKPLPMSPATYNSSRVSLSTIAASPCCCWYWYTCNTQHIVMATSTLCTMPLKEGGGEID